MVVTTILVPRSHCYYYIQCFSSCARRALPLQQDGHGSSYARTTQATTRDTQIYCMELDIIILSVPEEEDERKGIVHVRRARARRTAHDTPRCQFTMILRGEATIKRDQMLQKGSRPM
jgi:hypothetical protein